MSKKHGSIHSNSRRDFLVSSALGTAGMAISSGAVHAQAPKVDAPVPIGSRRELFIDTALIESVTGEAQQRLHHPVPREVVLRHDEAWEGTGSGYHSIFQDGYLYRMYYKAWHLDVAGGKVNTNRGGGGNRIRSHIRGKIVVSY